MEDFLIKGVTTAVLNDAGTVPFLRDVLHNSGPHTDVFDVTNVYGKMHHGHAEMTS